jgi:hypothetical protein
MTARTGWIDVDLDGLDKTLTRRVGLVWLLHELLANVYDTRATFAKVTLTPVAGRPLADLVVEDDDPDGFADLTHAFTLYAESGKKIDPSKRGRWNAGEKLVLARCVTAEVSSTTGTVSFGPDGRVRSKLRTDRGTVFSAVVRMTRDELDDALKAITLILPPIPTTINGVAIAPRQPIERFELALPTEIADDEGYLRRTTRQAEVRVYEPAAGAHLAGATLYELGIPVVDLDLPWSVSVEQKVPLNSDRDNVTPAYLRALTVAVVNRMHARLTTETAALPAVQEALGDARISAPAATSIVTAQYGDKRAVYDPSDVEANHRLVADGYRLIYGGSYTSAQHAQIRASGAALPAGVLRPTPRPYSTDGEPAEFIPEDEWADGMQNVAAYCTEIAWRLIKRAIVVRFERGRLTAAWIANYGQATLTFNYERLGGAAWFERGVTARLNELVIHELAHEREGNHLDERFYKALQALGAGLTELALREPELFKKYGWRAT